MAEFLSKTGLDALWKKIVAGNKKLKNQIDGNTRLIFESHASVSARGGGIYEVGSNTTTTITASGNVSNKIYPTKMYIQEDSGEMPGTKVEGNGTQQISLSKSIPIRVNDPHWNMLWSVVFEFLGGAVFRTASVQAKGGLYVYNITGTASRPTAADFKAGAKTMVAVDSKVTGSFTFNTTADKSYTWFAVAQGQTINPAAAEKGGLGTYTLVPDGQIDITNDSGYTCKYNLYRSESAQGVKTEKVIVLS